MGRRYFSLALLTEGASDQWFLAPLIDRQITELAQETPVGFDYSGVVTGECFTVAPRDTVVREVTDLLRYFDVVIIHHDHNERGKVDAVREQFAEVGAVYEYLPVPRVDVLLARGRTGEALREIERLTTAARTGTPLAPPVWSAVCALWADRLDWFDFDSIDWVEPAAVRARWLAPLIRLRARA